MEDDVRDGESQDLDQITKDYNLYEELEEERNTILYNKGDNRLEFLKRDYNDNTKDMSRFKTIQVICLILSLVSLGIMALVPSIRFYVLILSIVSLLGYQYNKLKLKKLKDMVNNINEQILELENKERERKRENRRDRTYSNQSSREI